MKKLQSQAMSLARLFHTINKIIYSKMMGKNTSAKIWSKSILAKFTTGNLFKKFFQLVVEYNRAFPPVLHLTFPKAFL